MTKKLTLERLLVLSGQGNRRHCAWLVRQGEITINGKIATDSKKTHSWDTKIHRDGARLRPAPLQTWLLHKPPGTICQTGESLPAALDLLPQGIGLGLIGRLDVDSEGLILATNDGDLAHRLAHPDFHVPKTYQVQINRRIKNTELQHLCSGLELDGSPTRPLTGRLLEADRLELILTEGRKRQIRRLCEICGLEVKRLVRCRVGSLELDDLAAGKTRQLSDDEVQALEQSSQA